MKPRVSFRRQLEEVLWCDSLADRGAEDTDVGRELPFLGEHKREWMVECNEDLLGALERDEGELDDVEVLMMNSEALELVLWNGDVFERTVEREPLEAGEEGEFCWVLVV